MDDLEDFSKTKNEMELSTLFPISFLSIFKNSGKYILISALLCFLSLVFLGNLYDFLDNKAYMAIARKIVVYCNLVILTLVTLKLAYEFLFYKAYYYAIQDGHLVISSGVLLKQRAAFPITAISDVYLDRKPIDFLFGLYNVHVSNPSSESHLFGDIKGLSAKNGVLLQDYLKQLNEKIIPENKKANYLTPENLRNEPVALNFH